MGRGGTPTSAVDEILFGAGILSRAPETAETPDDLSIDDYLRLSSEGRLAWRNPYPSGVRTAGLNFISDSDLLVADTGKEYRGHIALGEDEQGDAIFVGVTAWGPEGNCGSQAKRVYEGKSFVEALNEVNKMLEKKQSGSARSVYRPTQTLASREILASDDLAADLRQKLIR